jgi:Immunoglobulin I-set domain/Beta-propeller repeat
MMRSLLKILFTFAAITLSAQAQTFMPLAAPLYFEANYNQTGNPTQFSARGGHYQFLLSAAGAEMVLSQKPLVAPPTLQARTKTNANGKISLRALEMRFVGANPRAQIHGQQELPGKINYLIGDDSAQWHTGKPMFAKVRVEQIYPGINLVYYGNQQRLEYDFTIAPKTDFGKIAIHFDGVDKISIDANGELVLKLGNDEICQPAPDIYQTVAGSRKKISGGYKLLDKQTVAFAVRKYDRDLPLTIDPVLNYSTYFGGNAGDIALSVKVDASGSVYVAGETLSTQFPVTPGAYQTNFAGGSINGDAFVAKFDNAGTNLIYVTYLGGSSEDGALDLALDSAGDAYVTGFTSSTNFPVTNSIPGIIGVPGLPTHISGTNNIKLNVFHQDAFVAELNTNGSALVYSTYLGGNSDDIADGIAVDAAGGAYVTGYTYSTNFPCTNAYQSHLQGSNDVFVTQIAPGGTNLVYSTYFGGTNVDEGQGIAASQVATGIAYITGYTASTNFPTTPNAWQPSNQLNHSTNAEMTFQNIAALPFDAFVAKFNTTLAGSNSLVYSTLLGGTNSDAGFRIAVDPAGDAYVTGPSQSSDFPDTATNVAGLSSNVATNGGNAVLDTDGFLTKLGPNGTNVIYSALFGGLANDVGWDVALDSSDDAFVIGTTASTNFPTTNALGLLSTANSGGNDVFVTMFNADCSALIYSAYLGGSSDDYGYGIAVDQSTNAYIVGQTSSANFPTLAAGQTALDGVNDAFVAEIIFTPLLPTITTQPTNQLVEAGQSVVFTLTATGTPPLNYQWQLDGTNLVNGVDTNDTTISGATNATLVIYNAQTNNTGNYTAIVTNYGGSVTSSVAVLTVTDVPFLTLQPTNQTVGVGSTVSFTVGGYATQPYFLQWLKDGTNLMDGTNSSGSIISGSTNSAVLTISNAQTNDDGGYVFIVTNNFGSATSAVATLTVLLSPNFTSITAASNNNIGSFILSGVGGTNDGTYFVLTSTNLMTPLAQWTPIATNQFGSQGQFIFTNTAPTNTPQLFYLLQMESP